MQFYKKLYRVKRKAKDNHLSSKQRHELRQQESKPIMTSFKCWLDKHHLQVLFKFPQGNAVNYCLKYWNGLCEFLSDDHLEIDNNLTEPEIKPFVMARKKFLLASSVNDARALCSALQFDSHFQDPQPCPYHLYRFPILIFGVFWLGLQGPNLNVSIGKKNDSL
ncbi:transposase [Microbulbifer sp. VTAC004]|uniref:IS66 family transposase n=1 Tax=unclassified Microbulbifer TaxID=2619833 RepID=UPI004039B237